MVFRDPYILDLLKLSDSLSERDLEAAILRDIEAFLMENMFMNSGRSGHWVCQNFECAYNRKSQ
jgi:hypothetical protein